MLTPNFIRDSRSIQRKVKLEAYVVNDFKPRNDKNLTIRKWLKTSRSTVTLPLDLSFERFTASI